MPQITRVWETIRPNCMETKPEHLIITPSLIDVDERSMNWKQTIWHSRHRHHRETSFSHANISVGRASLFYSITICDPRREKGRGDEKSEGKFYVRKKKRESNVWKKSADATGLTDSDIGFCCCFVKRHASYIFVNDCWMLCVCSHENIRVEAHIFSCVR